MGRNGKGIGFDHKLEAVEKYLRGHGSLDRIASEYGIAKTTFRQWIANYQAMGPSGLTPPHTNQHYPTELKNAA